MLSRSSAASPCCSRPEPAATRCCGSGENRGDAPSPVDDGHDALVHAGPRHEIGIPKEMTITSTKKRLWRIPRSLRQATWSRTWHTFRNRFNGTPTPRATGKGFTPLRVFVNAITTLLASSASMTGMPSLTGYRRAHSVQMIFSFLASYSISPLQTGQARMSRVWCRS